MGQHSNPGNCRRCNARAADPARTLHRMMDSGGGSRGRNRFDHSQVRPLFANLDASRRHAPRGPPVLENRDEKCSENGWRLLTVASVCRCGLRCAGCDGSAGADGHEPGFSAGGCSACGAGAALSGAARLCPDQAGGCPCFAGAGRRSRGEALAADQRRERCVAAGGTGRGGVAELRAGDRAGLRDCVRSIRLDRQSRLRGNDRGRRMALAERGHVEWRGGSLFAAD